MDIKPSPKWAVRFFFILFVLLNVIFFEASSYGVQLQNLLEKINNLQHSTHSTLFTENSEVFKFKKTGIWTMSFRAISEDHSNCSRTPRGTPITNSADAHFPLHAFS